MLAVLHFPDLTHHHKAHEAHQEDAQQVVEEESAVDGHSQTLSNDETHNEPEQGPAAVDIFVSVLKSLTLLRRWNRVREQS